MSSPEGHKLDAEQEKIGVATDSSSYTHASDLEKASTHGESKPYNPNEDLDRDEVELMDAGHQKDLERQESHTLSIKAGPRTGNPLERVPTSASSKSRLSRVTTTITARMKRAKLDRDRLPLTDLDAGIVGWDSQEDPDMPLNFSQNKKWLLLGLISAITFISPLASSMFAPGVSFMDKDLHNTSMIISALSVSIFVLGYSVGPLLLAPLSEIYGRRPVLLLANSCFCVWQIGCALAPNIPALLIMRFLAGVGGSGCLTIGGGVIADLFHTEERGMATSIYGVGPLMGPVVGPICGGFVAQRASWRWIFWVLFISGTITTIGIECLNRETNPRVLIRRKTARLRAELSRPELQSCYTPQGEPSSLQVLRNGLIRPLRMIFLSPIVLILSFYMSVVYGLLYLLFTTITGVFISSYGWEAEIAGLAYMGVGLGFFLSLALVARLSDATVVRLTRANNGVFEPEMRLPACVFFACFIPITFFWYGWSVEKHTHWIVPILGLAPFGFGMIGIFIPIQTYLIDSFPEFAASSLAALTASRSLFATFLPLGAPKMYEKLGLGWGNSTLGFIAIALIPAPALIYKYGGAIRKNHPIKL